MATSSIPVTWAMPFTVADQSAIAALDPETRALVERYRRHSSTAVYDHAIVSELKSIRAEFREMNESRYSAEARLDEVLESLQPESEAHVA